MKLFIEHLILWLGLNVDLQRATQRSAVCLLFSVIKQGTYSIIKKMIKYHVSHEIFWKLPKDMICIITKRICFCMSIPKIHTTKYCLCTWELPQSVLHNISCTVKRKYICILGHLTAHGSPNISVDNFTEYQLHETVFSPCLEAFYKYQNEAFTPHLKGKKQQKTGISFRGCSSCCGVVVLFSKQFEQMPFSFCLFLSCTYIFQ